jgi:GMP synthase (glutamine-hydrolysing)
VRSELSGFPRVARVTRRGKQKQNFLNLPRRKVSPTDSGRPRHPLPSSSLPLIVLRHVPHEGLGTIASSLDDAGVPYRSIDTFKSRPVFPLARAISGLIVMGGPMGVYEKDRYPFLTRELRFIRSVIDAKKPILGICLGAQLVAHALGARVYPHTQKEIGWYRVHLTGDGKKDALFAGSPASPWVFQWHGDTFDLPSGAHHLAASALCTNQAFRYGNNVYGLQYHLEVDAAMVREWLAQPGAARELSQIGPRQAQKIKKAVPLRLPGLHRLAHTFFSGFAQAVRAGGQ